MSLRLISNAIIAATVVAVRIDDENDPASDQAAILKVMKIRHAQSVHGHVLQREADGAKMVEQAKARAKHRVKSAMDNKIEVVSGAIASSNAKIKAEEAVSAKKVSAHKAITREKLQTSSSRWKTAHDHKHLVVKAAQAKVVDAEKAAAPVLAAAKVKADRKVKAAIDDGHKSMSEVDMAGNAKVMKATVAARAHIKATKDKAAKSLKSAHDSADQAQAETRKSADRKVRASEVVAEHAQEHVAGVQAKATEIVLGEDCKAAKAVAKHAAAQDAHFAAAAKQAKEDKIEKVKKAQALAHKRAELAAQLAAASIDKSSMKKLAAHERAKKFAADQGARRDAADRKVEVMAEAKATSDRIVEKLRHAAHKTAHAKQEAIARVKGVKAVEAKAKAATEQAAEAKRGAEVAEAEVAAAESLRKSAVALPCPEAEQPEEPQDPCKCQPSWEYDAGTYQTTGKIGTYEGCSKTADADYTWCYVVEAGNGPECPAALASDFDGELRKWRKCEMEQAEEEEVAATTEAPAEAEEEEVAAATEAPAEAEEEEVAATTEAPAEAEEVEVATAEAPAEAEQVEAATAEAPAEAEEVEVAATGAATEAPEQAAEAAQQAAE